MCAKLFFSQKATSEEAEGARETWDRARPGLGAGTKELAAERRR